jgi:hypothetical protein
VLDTSSLVASAEVVFTNTSNNNISTIIQPPTSASVASARSNNGSQHASRAPSVNGSTHNSVIGSNTPRLLNNNDDDNANQIIEVQEIINVNSVQPQSSNPNEDDGFM